MRSVISLLSFYGRARRTTYGIYFAITVVGAFVVDVPFVVWSLQQDKNHVLDQMRRANPQSAHIFDPILSIPHGYVVAALTLSAILVLLLYIVWIAISVRRLHDASFSGWWVLIAVVIALFPTLGYLFVSLFFGLWPGTKGANRYGPDPRDPNAVADVFGRDSGPYRLEGALPHA